MSYSQKLWQFSAFAQKERFSCGPATIRMLAHHFGVMISEEDAGKLCRYSPKNGTIHWFFRQALEKVLNGVKVTMKHDVSWQEIESSLEQNLPVAFIFMSSNEKNPLVKDPKPGNYPHYGIILSVNLPQKTVFIANPFGYRENIDIAEFEKRWGLDPEYLKCENFRDEMLWKILKFTRLMRPRTCFILSSKH